MSKIISFIAGVFLLISMTAGLYADGARTFKKKCGSCHSATIDGKVYGKATMGPDLTGITSNRGADFIRLYISDPKAARKKYSDVYNKEIKGKYKMKMPAIKLKDADLDDLVESLK